MSKKLIKGCIIALGAAVLIVILLFFVRDTSRIINWSSSGFVLSSVQALEGDRTSFWGVDPADYIGGAIPQKGDTLVAIADSAASLRRWIDVLERPHAPGKEAVIAFLRDGDTLTTTIKTRSVQKAHFFAVIVLQILRFLIFISFLVVGFWAFFKRSDSPGVRTLTVYCITVSGFVGVTYLPMFAEMASFRIPLEPILARGLAILTLFFSSFWLLLNLTFPRHSRLLRTKPLLVYALCFLPQILVIVSAALGLDDRRLGYSIYSIFLLQVLAGMLILRYHHFHAENNLEKRQTKLVFWGSGVGLILFLVFSLEQFNISPFMRGMPLFPRLMLTNLFLLILLASPLSFAYAFGRYRLLEVEGHLKRGTQYFLVMLLMLCVLFGVVYSVGVLLLEQMGVHSRTPTLLIALVLALGFAPAQRNLRQKLENRFFPERRKLRQMAQEFLQSAATLPDCDALCTSLRKRFQEGLDLEAVYPVLRRNGAYRQVEGDAVPVNAEGDLIRFLRSGGHPLFVDEAVASGRIRFAEEELGWLQAHNVALVLPLRTHDSVLGFLALSYKKDREDFHPEELQILSNLSDQVAMVIENLSLLEENLQKKRMEEELQIARRVQMQFLPLKIPATPGLDVCADSVFSLEVAGDYYDVIPLQDDRTLLAVGDVSGKGAGAALIMANLQASLRALCNVGLELSELVGRINKLVYDNTDAEQYITFFVCRFDPRTRELTYVNAGHNAPILVRRNRCVELLEQGGTVLGAFADSVYQQATLSLASGDLVLIYTDGLSEATNASEEEFGEERIRKTLLAQFHDSPGEVLSQLTREVEAFRGGAAPTDDVTLLLFKIL
jgi:sigma-B regulation protein RsbU (phosphoserine phosphatase)